MDVLTVTAMMLGKRTRSNSPTLARELVQCQAALTDVSTVPARMRDLGRNNMLKRAVRSGSGVLLMPSARDLPCTCQDRPDRCRANIKLLLALPLVLGA
jgi:hypothetical protein